MTENLQTKDVIRKELSHRDFYKSLLCRLCLLLAAILITELSYFKIIEQPPFYFNGRNFENSYCYIDVKEISKPFAQFKNENNTAGYKAYIVKNTQNRYFVIVASDMAFTECGLNNLAVSSVRIKGISEKLTDNFLEVSEEAFKKISGTELESTSYLSVENKIFDIIRILGLFGLITGITLFLGKLYAFFKMKIFKKKVGKFSTKDFDDFEKIRNKIIIFDEYIVFERVGNILWLKKEHIYWIYSKNIYLRFSPKEIIKKRTIRALLNDGTIIDIYEVGGRKSLKKDFEKVVSLIYSALPNSLKGFTAENLKMSREIILKNKKTHL